MNKELRRPSIKKPPKFQLRLISFFQPIKRKKRNIIDGKAVSEALEPIRETSSSSPQAPTKTNCAEIGRIRTLRPGHSVLLHVLFQRVVLPYGLLANEDAMKSH